MVAEAVPAHQSAQFSALMPKDIGGSESAEAIGGTTANSPSREQLRASHATDLNTPLPRQASVSAPLRGFCHPLNGQGWLSQGIRGTTHRGRMEYAYDLAVSIGSPVYAMRAGKVIAVQDKFPDTGGGRENASRFNYVWIEHSQGYRSIYVHLQQGFREKVSVKAGDQVLAGQLIGYSGNSGWSSGPHLHIEVQRPGHQRVFTSSVPFAIAGVCGDQQVARATR
ncbi:MAG: M23 family metallopeptidase [Acaryochloridaceae cyanobacterium CSU_5_19]|nr:M23 family metallopeptidase [Acaryochloridaceae cyanobacterium CSU_5_19]